MCGELGGNLTTTKDLKRGSDRRPWDGTLAIVAVLRTPTLDVPQGTQVFYWRTGKAKENTKGRKYRDFDRWNGPGVVIGDE